MMLKRPFPIWSTMLKKKEKGAQELIDVTFLMKVTFLKGEAAEIEEATLIEKKGIIIPPYDFFLIPTLLITRFY